MSNFKLKTDRLYLRELDMNDVDDLFEMDSDPRVHTYLGKEPVSSTAQIEQVIRMLQLQYQENGIARWAVIDNQTSEFLGWCGLKFHRVPINGFTDIYELGYRFKYKHWGKGYATESANACIDYAKQILKLDKVYALTESGNTASKHVLKKLQFRYMNTFLMDEVEHDWFELTLT